MENKVVFKGKTKTGLNLVIRYLELKDTQKLTDFMNKVSQEKTFITFQGEKILLEDEKKYIDKKIKMIKEEKSVHLTAFIGDELVATSDIDMGDRTRTHVGLFGLIVSKEYRGHGIGKIIMNTIIDEATKKIKKLKIVNLAVFATNEIAQSLYKKMGFVKYGQLPQASKYKDGFVDEILMYKKIK